MRVTFLSLSLTLITGTIPAWFKGKSFSVSKIRSNSVMFCWFSTTAQSTSHSRSLFVSFSCSLPSLLSSLSLSLLCSVALISCRKLVAVCGTKEKWYLKMYPLGVTLGARGIPHCWRTEQGRKEGSNRREKHGKHGYPHFICHKTAFGLSLLHFLFSSCCSLSSSNYASPCRYRRGAVRDTESSSATSAGVRRHPSAPGVQKTRERKRAREGVTEERENE